MKTTISAEQSAFFTKQGYIEFEIPHPQLPSLTGHDFWRSDLTLKTFLLRKLGPLALTLSGKKSLRLGCDLLITKEDLPKKRGKLKEFLSLQGLAVGVALSDNPLLPKRHPSLGILPLPSTSHHVLFFRPDLILNWPSVTSDVYLAIFVFSTAVYVHNPNDPFTSALKAFGYQFGDCLRNEFNPLILG